MSDERGAAPGESGEAGAPGTPHADAVSGQDDAPPARARGELVRPPGSNPPAGTLKTAAPAAHLVVAEDHADLRDYLVGLLSPLYRVTAVADGAQAIAAMRAHPPDLVLSAVMMPVLDGVELLRALRADPVLCEIPVMLLSARAAEESLLEGIETGADDYLVKPFSARELLARVRTHLEMARRRRRWTQELESANAELEAFSYSVAHDLRAPLRAIDGFAALLSESTKGRLDAEELDALTRVRAAAQRMSCLIDALLSLSRINRAPLQRGRVDLTGLARTAIAELRERERERAVEVTIADGLVAEADPQLTAVVVANLIGNAWKYTAKRARARITVGSRREAGATVFSVEDDGVGFDPAYAGKLFSPFQRLHSEREFPGTGIGLATVHRIVTRHGGRVWAEAARDRGASFFFTLDVGV